MAGWAYDVTIEHTALATTGGRLWDAAKRLAAFLEASGEELGLGRPGLNVLELGAGVGYLSMILARNVHTLGQVVPTEQADGMEWLRHNVRLNAHLPGMASVRTCVCDWLDYGPPPPEGEGAAAAAAAVETTTRGAQAGKAAAELVPTPATQCTTVRPEDAGTASTETREAKSKDWLLSQSWDLVVGSDLVYNDVGARFLPHVLRALVDSSSAATVLYCHTKHRLDTFDVLFFEQLTECGLTWREVREPSELSPPPSPPPLTELFPEMRIVVYRIARTATAGRP